MAYAQYRNYGEATKQRRRANVLSAEGQGIVEGGFKEAMGYWRPYYDFGQNSLSDFKSWRADPSISDPSYEFRRKQGQEGVENSASAKGQLLSGNALRAISEYNQELASTEYAKEYERRLRELGIGVGATGAMSDLASRRGTIVGGMRAGMGQQNFQNAMAAMQEGRATAAQLNGMIQSWFPSYMGGGDAPSASESTSYGGSEFDMSSMAY